MKDVLATVFGRRTPQWSRADKRQVRNAAGGYGFVVDDWQRVHRFLTLGVDGGTYYATPRDLVADNAEVVIRAAATDPVELVRRIVEVSESGRAPRQNPALFALAIAAAADDVEGRRAALAALPRVARTGTHLFLFAGYVEQFRGWGPTLVRAVANWYTDRAVDELAYQAVKYRQREGWSHRDVLRLSHPVTFDPSRKAVFDWICRGTAGEHLPPVVVDFVDARAATTATEWARIINRGNDVSWEMLPDAALGERDVWVALLEQGIPQTALLRQLPRLTRLGLADGEWGSVIAERVADADRLARARVHPVNVLVAQRTYTSGRSARGESTWTPASTIGDALDAAFYRAYGAVQPAGKRTLLALDVSGSMLSPVAGLPLSCREASAALALVTAATEPAHRVIGFTAGTGGYGGSAITELDISPRRRLDDVCSYIDGLGFGATDCAAPMVWALRNRVEVDTFMVYTDNETWWGSVHPHQALREYREKTGIPARLAVVAMTSTRTTIADPRDPGQLDVSGFDSAVPGLLADFSRGDL
jgi:60 kDa SS-A/Ro ribonucleoprotein